MWIQGIKALSNDSYLAKFNSTGDKMITASCSQLTKRYEISLYVRRANQFKLLRKLDKTSKSKITKVSFSSSDTKLIVMTQKTNGEKTSVVFIISLIDDESRADSCVECMECLPICTQMLDIPKELQKVYEYFGSEFDHF